MLERIVKWLVIVGLAAFFLPGCGYLTKNGRSQMAYARYVRKQSHNHAKQVAKFKKVKVPKGQPTDYRVNAGTTESPQSVTSSAGDAPTE